MQDANPPSQPSNTTAPSDGVSDAVSDAVDTPAAPPLDLDRIERDLAAVEQALPRLDDGSYWIDEVTGEPIPDDVLAADPLARRA